MSPAAFPLPDLPAGDSRTLSCGMWYENRLSTLTISSAWGLVSVYLKENIMWVLDEDEFGGVVSCGAHGWVNVYVWIPLPPVEVLPMETTDWDWMQTTDWSDLERFI